MEGTVKKRREHQTSSNEQDVNGLRRQAPAQGNEVVVHLLFVFFFQAEDGIRDVAVTGVQTCALPISVFSLPSPLGGPRPRRSPGRAQPGQSPQTQPRGRRVPARHAPTQSRPEPRGNVPVPERGTGNRGRSLHREWLLSTSGGADRLAAASGTGTSDDLGRRFRNPGRASPAARLGRTYGRSHRARHRPFSAQRRLPPGTSRQGPQRTPGRSVHGGL